MNSASSVPQHQWNLLIVHELDDAITVFDTPQVRGYSRIKKLPNFGLVSEQLIFI